MDQGGRGGGGQVQARGGDTICNGADDDGSGTVGVMGLAEAFSQKGARPKRSMIFLTVSGEEKGLFGSSYFSEHPTVPLAQVVADLKPGHEGRMCTEQREEVLRGRIRCAQHRAAGLGGATLHAPTSQTDRALDR